MEFDLSGTGTKSNTFKPTSPQEHEAVNQFFEILQSAVPAKANTVNIVDIDFAKTSRAQFRNWLDRKIETTSLQAVWGSISHINRDKYEDLVNEIQNTIKVRLAEQQLNDISTSITMPNFDIGTMAKDVALRVTQVSGDAAKFDPKNPEAFNPYALVSFETLSARIAEGVQLVAQGKSLEELKVYK